VDDARAELARTFESAPIGPGTAFHVLSTARWKTIFLDAFVRRDLDDGASALALLPTLLRRGTRAHPDQRRLSMRLDELYGATLRTDVLKVGESQVLVVHVEVANPRFVPGAPPLFEAGLDLVRDVLLDPHLDSGGRFPADVVEQEKRNQVRFVEGLLNDKGAYAVERCCEEMCRGEPFAIYEYGSVDAIRALDAARLTEFWRALVDRAPIDVFVTGDVDADAARDAAAARFGRARRADETTRPPTPHPPARAVREVFEERPVHQGKLVLGLRSSITARDEAFPALLVANGVLGAYPSSKLFRVVREREGLCYYANSSLERTKGLVLAAAGVEARHYERARALIEREIAALQAGELTDEELTSARRSLVRGLETTADSATRTVTHLYGGIVNGRIEPVARLIEGIEAVRPGDVVDAARALRLDTVYFLRPPAAPAPATRASGAAAALRPEAAASGAVAGGVA
jgi:predicted Zn-dependent peptidase